MNSSNRQLVGATPAITCVISGRLQRKVGGEADVLKRGGQDGGKEGARGFESTAVSPSEGKQWRRRLRSPARNSRSLAAQKLGFLGGKYRGDIGLYIDAEIRGKSDGFREIFVELVSGSFPCRAWTTG